MIRRKGKRTPDFICIGAQKAGTTSLFQYLRSHPELFLPLEKELAFFSDDNLYAHGFDWYCDKYFSDVDPAIAAGEVSPQYMQYPLAGGRIRYSLPDIKLIAILRNPIDRAYSHYCMNRRRSLEKRSFCDALVSPQLTVEDPRLDYVGGSQYYDRLGPYWPYFSEGRLLILYTEDLAVQPVNQLQRVFSFLGVDMLFRPPDIGSKFNQSGHHRFEWLQYLSRHPAVRQLSRLTMPARLRDAVAFHFEQWNTVPQKAKPLTEEERNVACQVFEPSVASLIRKIGAPPPWSDFT